MVAVDRSRRVGWMDRPQRISAHERHRIDRDGDDNHALLLGEVRRL